MTVAQDLAPGFYPLQYFDDHTFELHRSLVCSCPHFHVLDD